MSNSKVKYSDNFIKGYIHKDNLKEVKAEMSRLSSMANKRIQRLENAGLQNSPTYKKWLNDGGEKFGVRGKDHNQLQRELSRLKKFIDAETSTVKGVNNMLKEMAKNTGIKYKNLADLKAKAPRFFELTSKVEQYLREVEDIASAFTSDRIFKAVNEYITKAKVDISDTNTDIEDLIANVTDLLKGVNNRSPNLPTQNSDGDNFVSYVPMNGNDDGWWFD